MAAKVYLLYNADDLDPFGHLLGVYSKREIAEKYRDLIKKSQPDDDPWIEEYGLIEEG